MQTEDQATYIQIICDKDYTSRISRPGITSPCGESFIINEEDIFVNPNNSFKYYFHICPNCGYIVIIPIELLTEEIRNRIDERCQKDANLFRKMYLYSELLFLDKKSTFEQRRMLVK